MGKRKQTAPVKASEEKRKCLSWNMLEDQPGSSASKPGLTLIDDQDPRLLQELEEAEQVRQKSKQNVTPSAGSSQSFYASDDIADIFSLHLENCLFYVSVLREPKLKPGEWSSDFGEFQVSFLSEVNVIPVPQELPEIGECWLYVGIQDGKSLLYYEIPDEQNQEEMPQKSKKKKIQTKKKILFWNVDISLSVECMEALKCSAFQVVIEGYNFKTLTIDLKIIATEAALSNLSFVSEFVRPKKQNEAVKILVEQFYGIHPPSYEGLKYNKKHDIDELYREIKQKHMEENRVILPNIQHPSFKPKLRLYQQQAITWMVEKEKNHPKFELDLPQSDELHMLYTEITTRDKQKLFYNKHGGVLVLKKPCSVPVPPAGILGEEMGLGKTVEVLGCMLHHQRTGVPKPEKLPVIVDVIENKKTKKKEKKTKKKKDKSVKDTEKSAESEEAGPSNLGLSVDDLDSNTGSTIIYAYSDSDGKNPLTCDTPEDQVISGEEKKDVDDARPSTSSEDPYHGSPKFQSIERAYACFDNSRQKQTDSSVQKKNDIQLLETETRSNEPSTSNSLVGKESLQDSGNKESQIGPDSTKTEKRLDYQSYQEDYGRLDSMNSEKLNLVSDTSKVVNENLLKPDSIGEVINEKAVENLHEKSEVIDKPQELSDSRIASIQHDTDSYDEIKGLSDNNNVIANSIKTEKDKLAEDKVMKRKMADINITETKEDKKPEKNIFTEMPACQREGFECICGATEAAATKKDAKKHPVQCVKCRLWQHAECVNYDLTDVYRGLFMCPHCHISSTPVVSGATLIISPASIAHQWVEEILKHVVQESLNVFMYTGVNKQGFIQPQTLAQQDIVITTYETLRKEIDYVDLPHSNSSTGRRLRHPKRFMAVPSPITAVDWWRICLDEAQMVECTTTKTAEMALKLSAVNRWCVTGTPIQKGVEDLYGLLLFLGVDPYWVQQWWHKLVYDPFCYGIKKPMHDMLSSVLWRTVKKDVLDQINIPKQTEHINWLTFSPVEDHFYRRQYKECSRLAMERLSKYTERSTRLSNLDRHTINQLLYPLLRLRQACCHPQAVRGEFLPIHKSTMTMDQLLESLTKKAKLEAEESHRALVASINGQAGLDIIDQQFVAAVEKYREVLRSVEEHKDTLHTDSLQQLHAMYNLHEILSSKPEGVDPTLRDDQLSTQITELKDKYMAKAIAYVTSTGEALAPTQLDVKSLQQQLEEGSEWWLDIIEWVSGRDQQELLIQKVKDDLLDNRNPEINSIARSIRSVVGLEYIIETHLSNQSAAYEKVLTAMKGLIGSPSLELINKTVECCLRPVGELLKTCPFCKSEELFEAYEARLFSFVEKGIVVNEGPGTSNQVKRQGTWADSEVEKTLKSILSFAKNFRADEDLIEFGTIHIKLFDALKKEYKKLRIYWTAIKEHVSSFDELDMATTRLRVRLPDEQKPDTPQPNILEPSELSHHKLKLASDKIVAEAELRKKLGQLLYLKNLEKSQLEGPGGDNPEPCPICQQELGKEWSVMQCGHCFCIECIRIVVDRYSFGGRHRTVKCAVCRQTSLHGEISYVTTTQHHSAEDEATLRVKGSHSTKVEAVVRCLLKIKRDDPTAKALVFSTWIDVLSVIATALSENGVEHRALYTPGKFQANLSSFKQDEEVSALLLPVHSGANGLNLIEATYVILVEPVLNPAQELQAIGRVHRIGQTRPTQVHRFLIKGTIEQKMQTLLESMDVKAATKNAEENALTIGDLVSLFTQDVTQMAEEGEPEAENQNEIEMGDVEEVEPPAENQNEMEIGDPGEAESEAGNQNEIEIEDVIANVEVSDESVQETDNGTQGEIKETVNIVNESSGSTDENEQPHDSDEEYDNTNGKIFPWWDNDSDGSYSDPYFHSDDDSKISGNSDCEESLSDIRSNETECNEEQVDKVSLNVIESVDESIDENVDVQSDVEVDDIIAMNEVDIIVVDEELSECRDEDVRIDNNVKMKEVAIDSARIEYDSLENTQVEKDAGVDVTILEGDRIDISIEEAVIIQNYGECAREGASTEVARVENSGIVEDARVENSGIVEDARVEKFGIVEDARVEDSRIVEDAREMILE